MTEFLVGGALITVGWLAFVHFKTKSMDRRAMDAILLLSAQDMGEHTERFVMDLTAALADGDYVEIDRKLRHLDANGIKV